MTMAKNNKHIWEGGVGIKISIRENGTTGEPFYTFELVRCFKREGSSRMEYTQSFSAHHAEAIGKVIQKALVYMHENPLELVADSEAEAA